MAGSRISNAVLVLTVAALAIAALTALASLQHGAVSLLQGSSPYISTGQAEEGKKLFTQSAVVDANLEKKEGAELSAMNKRMALAQKKLAQDQQKVKNILRRIKKVKTEDVIPNVQGARAEYDVDVRNDVTRQTHPGYRQQSWPRGFDTGAFDFPKDNFVLPKSELHRKDGSDAILDELQTEGKTAGLTRKEQWAEHVLTQQ